MESTGLISLEMALHIWVYVGGLMAMVAFLMVPFASSKTHEKVGRSHVWTGQEWQEQ